VSEMDSGVQQAFHFCFRCQHMRFLLVVYDPEGRGFPF
jgi:hypothetical protein